MAGNYELRTVNNAGHLVPMDQGAAARQMLKEFVVRSLSEVQAEKVEISQE
jgi:carboxypeptidase C (cathepsin A)